MYLLEAGVFVMLFCIISALQISEENPVGYIGGAIQYHPLTEGSSGSEIAEINAYNYELILKEASIHKVNIIVFPEYGLTGYPNLGINEKPFKSNNQDTNTTIVHNYRKLYADSATHLPDPEDEIDICESKNPHFSEWLKSLACSAKRYNIYAVINLYEFVQCPTLNCTPDNKLLYNTNIVIDNKGRLIAKYRKFNLFCEPWVDRPEKQELSIFTTDFNVTFAQLIDTDILNMYQWYKFFKKSYNIRNFVYSTRKFVELPMVLTTQDINTWSDIFHVTILAAGFSTDQGCTLRVNDDNYFGASGTSKKGSTMLYREFPNANYKLDKVLVLYKAEVQSISLGEKIEDVKSTEQLGHNWNLGDLFEPSQYESTPLYFIETHKNELICLNDFCCNFNIRIKFNRDLAEQEGATYYRYRLVALNARYRFNDSTNGTIELCVVMACTSDDAKDCGRRFPVTSNYVNPTTFDYMSINRIAKFNNYEFYGPLAQSHDKIFDQYFQYNFKIGRRVNSTFNPVQMTLLDPITDLHIFGISGRKINAPGLSHKHSANYLKMYHELSASQYCQAPKNKV